MASYQIIKSFPVVPCIKHGSCMEQLEFKVVVRLDAANILLETLIVEMFSNAQDIHNPEGEWKLTALPYRGTINKDCHIFGQILVFITEGEYQFIFRVRTKCELKGNSYPSEFNYSGLIIHPPRKIIQYANILKTDAYSHIIGILYAGNEYAGLHCASDDFKFTHVMCVAKELNRPFYKMDGICFCQSPLKFGIKKKLSEEEFKRAIIWIRANWKEGFKILVYSKYGFGRAMCVVLGFILSENLTMSYEDATELLSRKRPIFPHYNLKETIYKLFPRVTIK